MVAATSSEVEYVSARLRPALPIVSRVLLYDESSLAVLHGFDYTA